MTSLGVGLDVGVGEAEPFCPAGLSQSIVCVQHNRFVLVTCWANWSTSCQSNLTRPTETNLQKQGGLPSIFGVLDRKYILVQYLHRSFWNASLTSINAEWRTDQPVGREFLSVCYVNDSYGPETSLFAHCTAGAFHQAAVTVLRATCSNDNSARSIGKVSYHWVKKVQES